MGGRAGIPFRYAWFGFEEVQAILGKRSSENMMRLNALGSALILTLGLAGSALAFHEGGVAACSGCHVMHDSVDGRPVSPGTANNYQLLAESPSDVCLMCHAQEAGAVLGLNPLAPPPEKGGGNFVFLMEDNLNDGPNGRFEIIPGAAAGHNVVAPAYGLEADFRYTHSPGGGFPARDLGCTSCHDPHGLDGFRMLNGTGEIQGGIFNFVKPAPTAMGVDVLTGEESRTTHSVYIARVSIWCGNCHGRYHEGGFSDFQHPSNIALRPEQRQQYSIYEGDDSPTGGTAATSYIPEVAIADPSNTTGSDTNPSPASQVMCLTCHRAHASSAPAAGRWDFNVGQLQDDGAQSGSWTIPNPYGPNQGSLCRKCHAAVPEAY